MTTFYCEAAPHGSLLIANFLQFALIIFKMHGDGDAWGRWRYLIVYDCKFQVHRFKTSTMNSRGICWTIIEVALWVDDLLKNELAQHPLNHP